ncbi:hypothetical protein Bca52824_087363 [Brassica carinata]|uniref:Ubiquitin-like protease family profile domain-containing protein n=1 Tax=Brassica carinata TaxID=52824 RepID=A0A8X7PAJ7_BRACI|nr:hypothetical protein Bca52824_087363 [Brassica carinata]
MPGKKKLQLALIIIVDGVLIAHQQMSHPTMKYVRMVQDVDTFCSHPWGRESFIKTTTCMKPPKFVRLKCEDPIGAMLQLLKQETLRLRGFPLALQLLAYQAVPKLQSTIPIPFDSLWPDVSNDDRVSYMEQLIADHRPFTKDLWHVGVTSEPLITTLTNDEDQPKAKKTKPEAPPKNAYKSKPVTKKVLKARKTSKKKDTVRKRQKLELLSAISDQVSRLQKESKLLRKLLKRKKTTTSFKRSAFNTLLGEGLVKKGNTAFEHKGCQTEPTNVNVPVSIHDVCQTEPKADFSHHTSQVPMEEDHSHSPVISQYAAQLYGSTSHSNSTTGEPVHATSVHASPVHTSPIHNPQTPSSPINVSPVHTAHPSTTQLSTPPPYAPNPTILPSLRPRSAIYDASAHPNSPEAITPHPTPSLSQPKYDTSCNQSSQRRIFPLLPLHLTPELDSLPGFVGHATAINAFSATATSKPSSVPNTKPSSALQVQPTEDSDIVSLSDGSPAPETPKHIPSMEENHLAKQLLRCNTVPAPDLLSPIPQIEWDLFEKIISNFSAAFHITPSKLDLSNNFLLQLAQPMKETTTYHMEIIMHRLAARHRGVFEEQKLVKSKDFNKSRKRDTFEWDELLTDLVLQPGKKWMEDVVTVYTPMIWGDKHWAGLAINLDLGCVEVLDPLPTLYKDTTAGRFMAPVLKALPYLVKKVTNYQLTQFRGLAPFTWHRIKDLYINERGGGCGPVTVKFLEMHAHRDPEHMSSITDREFDDFRKQYVLDIYKTIVMPDYYPA